MATTLDLDEKSEAKVTSFLLHPDPPNGYDKKFTIYIQVRYSIDTTKTVPYIFEYQLQKQIPDDRAGVFAQTVEESEWTRIEVPKGQIDVKIKEGDALVVVEAVPYGMFTDLFWSINSEAIQTDKDRTSLYGDLKYGDGTTWQELADYRRDHPGDSSCRWISFKARLDPNPHPDPGSPERNHKFSYFFYLRNPQGIMQELEVDPEIKNPSS